RLHRVLPLARARRRARAGREGLDGRRPQACPGARAGGARARDLPARSLRGAARTARGVGRRRGHDRRARVSRPRGPDHRGRRLCAEMSELPPLLDLERVRGFLDEHGLGSGEVRARRIGEGGGSNFTFLLERDEGRFVLRRPPRPPLPPSAHDMVREARLQLALAPLGIRVPKILAVCEDESVLGVSFYVMAYLDGQVIGDTLPPELDEARRRRLAEDLVDTLVEIHAADVDTPGLAAFKRPGSYLDRQV